jgi:hypothetical protein
MWILLTLLEFLGPKKFLRFLVGSALVTLFFLYSFVHEAFDQPKPPMPSRSAVHIQRWPLSAPDSGH